MTNVILAIVSFLLVVQSFVSFLYIVKCCRQMKAISDAYHCLVGIDGKLPHDAGRIKEAKKMLLDEIVKH